MSREKANFDVLKRIDEERIKRNWTEYTLAKNSGLTQSTISTWYRKDLQPSIASIEKICNGLGITLSAFFNEGKREDMLTQDQHDILQLWSTLTEEQRKCLLQLLRAFQPLPDNSKL